MTGRARTSNVHCGRRWLARPVAALIAVLGVAVTALAATAIAATPAYAQGPADVTVAASGNPNLEVGGGAQRVVFTIGNNGPGDAGGVTVRIDVPLGDQGVTIIHGPDGCQRSGNTLQCSVEQVRRGGSERIAIRIQPPKEGGPAQGQSQQGQGQAQVGYQNDVRPDNNTAGFTVTLNGPKRPANIPSVAGTVTDNKSSDPVKDAKVVLEDSKGTKRETTTNDSGKYKITSTDNKPIAPGSLEITVTKKGYQKKTLTKTGDGGEAVQANILMIAEAKPSASAKPTVKDTGAADEGPEEGSNWLAWLFYLFAALLLLGGIGLIVWLVKGRGDEDDEDDEYDGPRGRPAAPVGAHGVYRSDPYGAPTTAMGGAQ
ncbi:MAG: carboxypeptidase-like regulatory domain-containing protein, partial [Micromonosporaceae bacterium]